MGVVPTGHPDPRPWIAFEDWPAGAFPLRKGCDGSRAMARGAGDYRWIRAEGEGVYEIPVGPVHAGIIEPGHFRFQAVGEDVVNLEERLGYVHKGIEKRFEALPWAEGHRLAGRVSGDTTVAHALAWCMAYESLSGCAVPERAHWLRALLLERERIANHLGDLGAIANDAAFAFFWHQMMRLKEGLLRTNRALFGHRSLMDRVVPGGVAVDLTQDGAQAMARELDAFLAGVRAADHDLRRRTPRSRTGSVNRGALPEAGARSVRGRLRRAGERRSTTTAASSTRSRPTTGSRRSNWRCRCSSAATFTRAPGCACSRCASRCGCCGTSSRTCRRGPCSRRSAGAAAAPAGFAAVEGLARRDRLLAPVRPGGRGQPRVWSGTPPSVNWIGLEQAMPGNIVPDFPLCNKSFNQSYSGHDCDTVS